MDKKDFFWGYEEITKEWNFDFSKHSSIGVGGKAKIAFYPENENKLKELIFCLKQDGIGYIVLGNLTNVLPPDNDIEKVVICTKRMVDSNIGERIYISAGVTSGCLLKACRYAKKSGMEFLAGIPCTLGGALYMNAGVNGRYIAEMVDNVVVYRDGEILTLSQDECGYSYKNSVFMKNQDIILGATLCLTDSDEATIRDTEEKYLNRRAHLPKGKSMGCVFKNPDSISGQQMLENTSAGAWIEKAGLKGVRCGDAYISEEHSNFIINGGNATSGDIHRLIKLAKEKVYQKFQIALQEEIRYLE